MESLKISHRKRHLGKDADQGGKMMPLQGEKSNTSSRLPASHRYGVNPKRPKRPQIGWRVVGIYSLSEYRNPGEQRLTIKDATLPGVFTGYSEGQARVMAERKYGELPYAKYALLRLLEWRVVRNQKGWPPVQGSEESTDGQA